VSGFPTIKFMYHDGTKLKSVDYTAGRTAKDIITFAMDKAKSLAFKRIGQKSGGSSSGGSGAHTLDAICWHLCLLQSMHHTHTPVLIDDGILNNKEH
jgi:hypothetical protein